MAAVRTAIPTAKDLQKLSAEIGRVHGKVEQALWRLEVEGKSEAENPSRIGAELVGHIAYFVEGLRLDAMNLKEWADRFEQEALALFEGWPGETSPA